MNAFAPPLDYWPLADFIERWPALVPALDERLRPGHGDCEITADEVGAASVDGAEEVREAAVYWLREQGAQEPGADEPA